MNAQPFNPRPPSGLEHETALLGALLQRPLLALQLPVRAEHYARPLHAAVHEVIVAVAEEHRDAAGVMHVIDALRRRRDRPNLLASLRNGTVLVDYISWSATAAGDPGWHAEQVIEAWRRQHLRALGTRLSQLADLAEQGADPGDVVEHAMDSFLGSLDVVGNGHWEPPTPLGARRALPPFPVDALPSWVADQVAAVATFTQTPLDLAGNVALAALSAAAGGRAVVQIRPGWVEPVNLYTVVAMPPGSRKSAVFATMTHPLLLAEERLVEQTAPRIIDAQLAQRTAQRDAERHASAAANATVPEARAEALGLAADAALAAEQLHVPPRPRLVADDVTAEAASSLLAEQGGRLAVLSAEGGIFATIAGRYSTAPNLEVFLKGHAGDLLRVDRKGRAAEHVAHPALTLGLAVQPDVLREIAHMPGFRSRGLLARILYALPANTVGRRQVGAPAVPEPITAAYTDNLRALALSLADLERPASLVLTDEADARMLQLESDLEPRLADGAELGHIADWASKLNGAIARIAGLLHLAAHLRDGWGRAVATRTIDAAARLGDYYLTHALAVFDLMDADPVVEAARVILGWITRTGRHRFTRRELFTAVSRARFPKATDLDAPLALLEQHGYLRRGPAPASTGGRPGSPPYDVNPHTHAAEAAEAAEAPTD